LRFPIYAVSAHDTAHAASQQCNYPESDMHRSCPVRRKIRLCSVWSGERAGNRREDNADTWISLASNAATLADYLLIDVVSSWRVLLQVRPDAVRVWHFLMWLAPAGTVDGSGW
jgi:hypothetical protein